ncbi:helix-turn-helix domain-containing protein [Streptomyces violaceusniger]|uniref:helix-turn-helix domain-containing protein n=1 Tax=Streptomyces violaceusniger TaxID=68280 RepID=UPI0013867051
MQALISQYPTHRPGAHELRIAADTMRKWRRRFLAERLDGLADEPRSGRPPTISVGQRRTSSPSLMTARR